MTTEERIIILQLLASKNEAKIIIGMQKIKLGGDVSFLPAMIEAMAASDSDKVEFIVLEMIKDLTSTTDTAPLVELLKNNITEGYRTELISSFWQSRLDFSSHLIFFIDFALHSHYLECLETITLIENMSGPFKENEIEFCFNLLEKHHINPSDPKELLIRSLKDILNELKLRAC